mmetsp:Transcript_66979/g.187195  ORF Transcript_66979/g.187195 Transcript_66979/m.187195 type:complete len:315 (-) Transcript_66979:658-1602(-)
MDTNSVVKVCLGGTHLDSNCDTLNHLTGTVRCHMDTDDLVCVGIDNELEEGVGFRLGEGVLHGSETRCVDINILELFQGFGFCVSHSSDFGIGKDSGSDKFVVDRAIHSTKESIGQAMTFHQGDRSQGDTVGDVSHRVDTLDVGSRVLIHRNKAVFCLDTCRFQVEVVQLSLSAGGHQHLVAFHFLSVLCNNCQRPIRILPDFLRISIELNVNIGVALHFITQMLSHILVESSQEHISTVHQCDIRTQSIHNLREFQGDKASTHDDHTLGLFFQIKDFVGSDCVFNSRNSGFEWPSTDRDQNVFRFQCLGLSIR